MPKTYWNPYGRGTRKPGAIEPTDKQVAQVAEVPVPAVEDDEAKKKTTRRKAAKRKG